MPQPVWANAVDPADESLGQIWSLNGPSLKKPQKPLLKTFRVKVSGGDFSFCADSPRSSLTSPRQVRASAPPFLCAGPAAPFLSLLQLDSPPTFPTRF
ncbi:hypothetical protein ACSS6W_003679 [Trichoderma asperelloides]